MAEKTQLLRKNLPTVNCAPGETVGWVEPVELPGGVIEVAVKGGWDQ